MTEGLKGTGWSKIKEGTERYANGHGKRICRICNKWVTGRPLENCPKEHFIVYENQLKYRDIERVNIMRHYGDKCACLKCGFNDFNKKIIHSGRMVRFLNLDHINGGGHEQMKKIHSIFGYIKKNDYPSGFRILCAACNASMNTGESICEFHRWIEQE